LKQYILCELSILLCRICQPKTDDRIQNGTKQNNYDDCVDNLFEEAQKIGAICSEQAKADTIITLWKNGFTVNDGELRSYTDVANQRFLDSIKKGELPFELQKICDKEEVDVKVDDKKDELYTSLKAVFHPFSGAGYRLGSATPRIISKVKKKVEGTEKRKPTLVLNNSEPITRIQIWLADGARIVQNFNISHRLHTKSKHQNFWEILHQNNCCGKIFMLGLVCFAFVEEATAAIQITVRISHVRDFIIDYQRHQERRSFTLTTSLPFRELLNESLTLEEANLKNAVVVQRLKNNIEPFRSFSS
uniref:UBX domain protein 2A n=1 Tax=Laticauda laticaudata TaxID=8630 RepID=A0A8C5S455_LATLA